MELDSFCWRLLGVALGCCAFRFKKECTHILRRPQSCQPASVYLGRFIGHHVLLEFSCGARLSKVFAVDVSRGLLDFLVKK